MKTEAWNGHGIRFVEKDGQWWAVAADVCKVLGLENITEALRNMPEIYVSKCRICDLSKTEATSRARKTQDMNILSELGVYRLIMRSNKPEAKAFQKWVFSLLKSLREALGYKQWKLKAFTDSVQNHHLNMDVLKEALNPVSKVPYIKAQAIVNKCMANIAGEAKAIGKDDLKERFPDMLPLRDEVLTDTVQLMALNERLGLGLSVSEAVYAKYAVCMGGAA